MRHFIAQFGPALEAALDEAHGRAGADDEASSTSSRRSRTPGGGSSIAASWSASATTASSRSCRRFAPRISPRERRSPLQEERLLARAHRGQKRTMPHDDLPSRCGFMKEACEPDWIDYNNHLTESRYLQVFGDATDALTAYLGVDGAYRASTGSYSTVETHMSHLREIAVPRAVLRHDADLARRPEAHPPLPSDASRAQSRPVGDRRADAPPRRCRERPRIVRKPRSRSAPCCVAGRSGAVDEARAGGPPDRGEA